MNGPSYSPPETWALVGVRSQGQAMLYQGYVEDFSYHVPRQPLYSLGNMTPMMLRSGPPEMEARIRASQAITAATFAECMKILAGSWQPDVPHGITADWRPVPR